MSNWQRLGDILQNQHGLSEESIERACEESSGKSERLGEALMRRGVIDAGILARALATQRNLEYLETLPDHPEINQLLDLIPIGFAKHYKIFPLEKTETTLKIAVANPCDMRPLNDLATLTGLAVEPLVATTEEIFRAINSAYERQAAETDEVIEEIEGKASDEIMLNLEPEDLIDSTDEAPVIRFVNSLITQGLKKRASDIHIEPFEKELNVRYRIDGILYEVVKPPVNAHAGIVSRIKIMAQLNIAEKRLPQDGRFRVRVAGRDMDIRVSTLPTAFGERVVLRLLDKAAGVLSLAEIGMDGGLREHFESMINKSHGIVLVTGPTGSGKTTSLYAALTKLNTREKNIITVEDPIEYQLKGVGQIQVNPKIQLTFANGLRSILRQDPDIIMVGEIRDRETAEIAVQSALTGHLVFSTLHTNDAAGALTRLVEMGIEPFLAASSIVGILAQRLVRKICPHCKIPHAPPQSVLNEISEDLPLPEKPQFFRGAGCEKCMQIGYWGRTGLYELLKMDDAVRTLLLEDKDAATIKKKAVEQGMRPLRAAGLDKAINGVTTLEEVLRVTQEEA